MNRIRKNPAVQFSAAVGGLRKAATALQELTRRRNSSESDFSQPCPGKVAKSQLELIELRFKRLLLRKRIETLKQKTRSN